jgi:hypothetical protein
MRQPSPSSVPADGPSNSHPTMRSLSVDIPFEAWLAVRTASISSNMPLKTYLSHFLKYSRPINPDGTLTEPIPSSPDKDVPA